MGAKRNGDLYQKLRQLWKDANPHQPKNKSEQDLLNWWALNKGDRAAIESKMATLNLKIKSRGKAILNALSKHKLRQKPTDVARVSDGAVPSLVTPSSDLIFLDESVSTTELNHALFENGTIGETNSEQMDEVVTTNEALPESAQELLLSEPHLLLAAPVVDISDNMDLLEGPGPRSVKSRTVTIKRHSTPVQDKIREDLDSAKRELENLERAKASGLILVSSQEDRHRDLKKYIREKNNKLKRLLSLQKSQLRFRESKGRLPTSSRTVRRTRPGRPRVEEKCPGLLQSILDIISITGSADEKRRTEALRSVHTLNQLLAELTKLGYNISRSGLYLRLLPRNCATAEGKRHVKTVPVKLLRATNNKRKFHPDAHFATSTIKFLKDLSVVFGPKTVCCISQDDKAKVPLGLPAANKQGPILMKVDYKVMLPDHDFVVASKHKLIPSVYAGLEIKEDHVSYSGPTYIAIRSGKHDSSTAPRHGEDLNHIMHCEAFRDIAFTKDAVGKGTVPKPILILFVDGGPDENPRFPKTLKYAAINFKRLNLDAMFLATHAPGYSAFNPVERRMAPLSRDLCGLILPHDEYGTHLNKKGETVNEELEVKNFQKAGEILCDVWNERVIDGFPVTAEYVVPKTNSRVNEGGTKCAYNCEAFYIEEEDDTFLTEVWKSKHVRQSKYLLQIAKCGDDSCCLPPRTNLAEFLSGQFIPAPIPLTRSSAGLQIDDEDSEFRFFNLTTRLASENLLPLPVNCYDQYCPSVKVTIAERTCKKCGEYFVTKAALKSHMGLHRNYRFDNGDYAEADEVDDLLELELNEESDNVHIIDDLDSWFTSVFVECNVEAEDS